MVNPPEVPLVQGGDGRHGRATLRVFASSDGNIQRLVAPLDKGGLQGGLGAQLPTIMNFLLAFLLTLSVDGARTVKDAQGNIVELDLTSTWVTDGDLSKVAQMRHLRKLDLSHTRVTDAGLEQLKSLENVVELNCYYAERLTEDGIAHLRGWKHLEHLSLRGTKVTSQVFEHLAHLDQSAQPGFGIHADRG